MIEFLLYLCMCISLFSVLYIYLCLSQSCLIHAFLYFFSMAEVVSGP